MMRKSVIWLLSIVLLCVFQVSRGDVSGDPTPSGGDEGAAVMTTMATGAKVEESYENIPMLKAVIPLDSDRIHGELTFSLRLYQDGAKPQLWSTIYEDGAAADATVTVKILKDYYFPEGGNCTDLVSEDIPHNDIVVNKPLVSAAPSAPAEVPLDMQVNMTGEYTIWDSVFVVTSSDGYVTCAFPKLVSTKDVKVMPWTYSCYDEPTWGHFADSMEKAQIRLSLIQPIPVTAREWFYADKRGCCHSKLLLLGSPKEAELERIYKAAKEEMGFGKFSMSQTCYTNLRNSFLWDKLKKFEKAVEKPDDKVVECPSSKTADWMAWSKAFKDWQQQFYNNRVPPTNGGYTPEYPKKLNAFDQLVYGLGFTSAKEMNSRKQEAVQSLQGAVTRLQKGDDIRQVAGDIIGMLYTQNEWIRKPAETKSVVKEIMCRIGNSDIKEQAIGMIVELLKEMKEDSEVTLDVVLDRVIRGTILYLTEKYRFGDMVQMVFEDSAQMTVLLRQKFMEGLGLDGAGDAFTHYTVEIYGDYIKSQANALNASIQAYKKFNSDLLSSDTMHILTAVSKLTGAFAADVVDNLANIMKYPYEATEVSGYTKHVIEDLIAFDSEGRFTEDLKYMLGEEAAMPIAGLPLRLMIYVIQPNREECNFEELLAYVPQMPKKEANEDEAYNNYNMGYGDYDRDATNQFGGKFRQAARQYRRGYEASNWAGNPFGGFRGW